MDIFLGEAFSVTNHTHTHYVLFTVSALASCDQFAVSGAGSKYTGGAFASFVSFLSPRTLTSIAQIKLAFSTSRTADTSQCQREQYSISGPHIITSCCVRWWTEFESRESQSPALSFCISRTCHMGRERTADMRLCVCVCILTVTYVRSRGDSARSLLRLRPSSLTLRA